MIVGIDIGTSYSSIALQGENGQAEPVIVANGAYAFGDKYSLPSAIFVEEDGSIVIGQLAMTSRMKDPACFKGEFKRDLGQTEPFTIGNLQILPEDIYKEMFIYFKECAEKAGGQSIGKAYISYPANYSKKKRELIKEAAHRAGLLDVELVDEPTAAAYCYYTKGKIQEGDTLLVYDFGGGTFDLALIQYKEGSFRQLTSALGIDRCGGIDIDRLIFDDIYNTIPEATIEMIGGNETYKRRLTAQIMEASVRIKHELSTRPQVKETIAVGWDTLTYQIDHTKLNQMIAPLVEETLVLIRQILKNAKLKAAEINSILIVGGTSRTPYIQQKLKEIIGRQVSYDIDPELAVCFGAALWKSKQSRNELEKGEFQEKEDEVAKQLLGSLQIQLMQILKNKLNEVTNRQLSYDVDPELAECTGATLWERDKTLISSKEKSSPVVDEDILINPLKLRELKTLNGHSGWIYSVVYSPDGKYIASGSADKTIKIWDTSRGQEIRMLRGHSDWVYSVAFSPDSKYLASGSADKTIKIWNMSTGQEIKTLIGHSDWVYSVVFSPGGRQLASGSRDQRIKEWDTSTGQVIKTFKGHSGNVNSIAYSPDGKAIASGGTDKMIKIWNVSTGQEIKTLIGHSDWVYSVVYSPDGKQLASGSRDKTIKIWDISTCREINTLTDHSESVNSVAYSPEGKYIASGSVDKTIKIWDTGTGQVENTLKGHSGMVYSVAYSPEGKYIISVSLETIKLWGISTKKQVSTKKQTSVKEQISTKKQVSAKEEYELGYNYYFGKNGKEQNNDQAVYWLTKAAERGESSAYIWLGIIYQYGQGVTKNLKKAIFWYTKTAQEGNSVAQCSLGQIYESMRDYDQAQYWYSKAAAQGDKDAIIGLGKLKATSVFKFAQKGFRNIIDKF